MELGAMEDHSLTEDHEQIYNNTESENQYGGNPIMEGLEDNLETPDVHQFEHATTLLSSTYVAEEPILEGSSKKPRMLHRSEIRRPTSKWILFLSEKREGIKKANPDFGFLQIARELAIQYKAISPEDSDRLDAVTAKDKARYQEELKHCLTDKESGKKAFDVISNTELVLPVVRVKRAIKLDPEVKAVGKEAVAVLTKATELFTMHFVQQSLRVVATRGAKQMKEVDTINAVHATKNLEFLTLDFPKAARNKKAKASQASIPDVSTGVRLNVDGQPRKKLGRPTKQPNANNNINKYFQSRIGAGDTTASSTSLAAAQPPAPASAVGPVYGSDVDLAGEEEGEEEELVERREIPTGDD